MPWYVNQLFSQAAPAPVAKEPSFFYINLLVAVGVMAVSVVLGNFLGKKLRMPDHGWKIGLIFFSLLASVAILVLGPPLKLGVDLSGGVIIVYEVDQAKRPAGETVNMDKLIEAVKRRVNPGGQKEVVIRPYGTEASRDHHSEGRRGRGRSHQADHQQLRQSPVPHLGAKAARTRNLIERAMAEPDRAGYTIRRAISWHGGCRSSRGSGEHQSYSDIAVRERKKGKPDVTEVLVLSHDYNVTGAYLSRANTGADQKGKAGRGVPLQRCRRTTVRRNDQQPFARPGEREQRYELGVILDGLLYSAPTINATIFDSGDHQGKFHDSNK